MRNEISVMGKEGDSKIYWSVDNEAETKVAESTFNQYKGLKYLAFRMDSMDQKGEPMDSFDKIAGKILFIMPMAGG